jgi:hypothetical protein
MYVIFQFEIENFCLSGSLLKTKLREMTKSFFFSLKYFNFTRVSLRGVVVDLSGLRDRGPGFKTRSRDPC